MNRIVSTAILLWVLCIGPLWALPVNPAKPVNLTELAETVAKHLYSYNFENIEFNLTQMKPYFTERGYRRYRKALAISKNVDFVRKNKMQVTGVLLQGATLEKQLNKNEWVYRTKMKVTFSGPGKTRQNTLWVLMRLVRFHGKSTEQEIGVDQVVAYPTSLEPKRA